MIKLIPDIENHIEYRSDITQELKEEDIKEAIRMAEFGGDCKINLIISNEQYNYIKEYAKNENVNISIAIQWFWNVGFQMICDVRKMKEIFPSF